MGLYWGIDRIFLSLQVYLVTEEHDKKPLSKQDLASINQAKNQIKPPDFNIVSLQWRTRACGLGSLYENWPTFCIVRAKFLRFTEAAPVQHLASDFKLTADAGRHFERNGHERVITSRASVCLALSSF